MAMAFLNGLPKDYNVLISALDAIDEDETILKFEFIKSGVMQEEQRILMRRESAQVKSEAAALLSSQSSGNNRSTKNNRFSRRRPHYCNYCKQPGHNESKCCEAKAFTSRISLFELVGGDETHRRRQRIFL